MEMDENIPSELSKYNEAQLQIQRLHNLWVKIEDSIDKGHLQRWKYLLDSVWRELYADAYHLTKPEEILERNVSLRKKIANNGHSRNNLYDALNERHEFLKKLQDDVGKGGIYQDGRESEFE